MLLLGLNVGLLLLSAGIHKMLDPLWRQGDGLRYAVGLPWIKPGFLDGIEALPVWTPLNWFVIVLELAVVGLYVVPRTRPLGVAAIAMFFAGLIFPLRFDFIGPLGMTIALILWIAPPHVELDGHSKWIAIGLVVAFGLTLMPSTYSGVWRQIPVAVQVNATTTRLQPVKLFSAMHVIGVWEYRVVHELKDGRSVEPLEVFRANGSPGRDSGGFLSGRALQSAMYPIGDFAHQVSHGEVPPTPPALNGVVALSSGRVDGAIASTTVLVAPIDPCGDDLNWHPLLQISGDGVVSIEPPQPVPAQARMPHLENFSRQFSC